MSLITNLKHSEDFKVLQTSITFFFPSASPFLYIFKCTCFNNARDFHFYFRLFQVCEYLILDRRQPFPAVFGNLWKSSEIVEIIGICWKMAENASIFETKFIYWPQLPKMSTRVSCFENLCFERSSFSKDLT